ncbi:hemicentin-1-like [Anneissia japonica]|uniref:hemicentin-1-like n=1 Tax=Anneissia japonica TaxID=1529436 RepID=UPI001425B6C3|nr:hemicentin-1-like [Anneissia japonica]
MHEIHWLYLMLLLLKCSSNEAYNQLVSISDQVVKEGDARVVLSCDYSKVNSTLNIIRWDEVNNAGATLIPGIVSDKMMVNGRYSLETQPGKANLVVSKPGRNDSGRFFQCQIRIANGDYIHSPYPANITVYYLDEPVATASASIVNEGKSVNLTCSKLDGDPVPNSISWYKDGQALNVTDTSIFTTSEDELEIHIKFATSADGGLYTCKAESDQFNREDGKTSAPFNLTVNKYYLDKPVITASEKIVYEGDSVTLTCSTPDGNPDPNSITWYKNGQALNSTNTTKITKLEDTIKIHIKAATVDNGGRYTCKTESDKFKGENGKTSAPFDLRIIEFYISLKFKSEICIATCIADSYPKPSYVMIFQDGNKMETGELSASVEINEHICKSNITCFAENGEVNATEKLKSCNPGVSNSQPTTQKTLIVVVIVTAVTAITLGFVPTCLICRYIHKRQERRNRLQLANIHQYQGMAYKRTSGKYEIPNVDTSYCDVDAIYEQSLHL